MTPPFFRVWIREWMRPLSLGEQGERVAARYLRRLGYHIVALRLRHRYGEIDIIAVDKQTVVFVEVKTRRNENLGRAAEAVDEKRQTRLTRAALAYLTSHDLLEYASRFDVMEVIWPAEKRRPEVRHLIDAFPPVGKGQMFT